MTNQMAQAIRCPMVKWDDMHSSVFRKAQLGNGHRAGWGTAPLPLVMLIFDCMYDTAALYNTFSYSTILISKILSRVIICGIAPVS